jgi:hypothetical protein
MKPETRNPKPHEPLNLRNMKKSDVPRNPNYFDTYINKVEDIELDVALQQSLVELDALDMAALRRLGDQVYAPGKWTVRDIIQHITDCERVFCYRALSVGRGDTPKLPGFDENTYAVNAGANSRSLEEVIAELRLVRQGSIALFRTFDEAALRRMGVMFNYELPVLAIGFILAGHQRHHFGVIQERYLPLIQ